MSAVQDIAKQILHWLQDSDQQDLVPLEVWCEKNGRNDNTVRSWKSRKVIKEGVHVFKDPTGHLWLSCSAMQEWVKSGYAANDDAQEPAALPPARKPGRPKRQIRRGGAPKLV